MKILAKFWVVWSPKSGEPTRSHKTYLEAKMEAQRLARKEPNKTFYVMSPEISCKVKDIEETLYATDVTKEGYGVP